MLQDTAGTPVPTQNAGVATLSGAVDHIAAGTGVMLAGLGAAQIFLPTIIAPFTSVESGIAGQIIGLQWIAFGGLLTLGGILRTRVLTIFAGEFVMLSALAAMAVILFQQRDLASVLIYGFIAVFGFASSGFARLTDKAALKREIKLLREQAKLGRIPVEGNGKAETNA